MGNLSLEDLEFRLNKIYALVEPLGSPGAGTRALKKNSANAGDYSWHPSTDPDGSGGGGSGTLVGIAISALPDATTPLAGTELVPMVQGGITSKATTQDIANLAGGGGGSLPITADDGTNTVTIAETSHGLRLTNTLDAGTQLQSRLLLEGDGTVYIEARDQIIITSYLGSFKNTIIDAGNFTNWGAYCMVESDPGSSYSFAGLRAKNNAQGFGVELEVGGTYLNPTFHVGSVTTGLTTHYEKVNTAADSSDLGSSDFTMWLDDTPGSAAIKFKAKNSSGTVVNGSIALT